MATRVVVVVSRFNEGVTSRLRGGALEYLETVGFGADTVDVISVPGAFELPVTIQRALATGNYAFGVALGAVIRGETPHFDFISAETTRGLGAVALETGIPVGFGLLTCDTLEQAEERAGGAAGNKGIEAAEAAYETHRALDRLDARS